MLSNYFANEYTFEFPFKQFVEEKERFIKECGCKIKEERDEFIIKIEEAIRNDSLFGERLYPKELIYKINKINLPEFKVIPQYNGIKFHYKIICEPLLEDEKCSYIMLDSKRSFVDQLEKKYPFPQIHNVLLLILGLYFERVCEYRTEHLVKNVITGWKNSTYKRIFLNSSPEEDEEGNQRMYMFKLE